MFYVLTSVTMYSYYGKKIVYSSPYADELAAYFSLHRKDNLRDDEQNETALEWIVRGRKCKVELVTFSLDSASSVQRNSS